MTRPQRYWTYYYNAEIGYKQVFQATWTDHPVDFQREKEGRIFMSQMDAIGAFNRWLESHGTAYTIPK